MPVFISYSHTDKEFAEGLAFNLIANNANVWLDKWELNVGDSLIDKIQGAIKSASALIVILSPASAESEWCKKELSSGLIRELEEKRVFVLPVVIEDCEIPLFLRDKLYADFREDPDEAFRVILQSIAKVTTDSLGRMDTPEFLVDWATDWGLNDENMFYLKIILIEHGVDQPITCLSEVMIVANEEGTEKCINTIQKHNDRIVRLEILDEIANAIEQGMEIKIRLSDNLEKNSEFIITNEKLSYSIIVSARRLGEDTGRDILLSIDQQILGLRDSLRGMVRNK